MSQLLLPTKLFIPPQRPSLTPRPRLINRLNERIDSKLTLIAAPAGFGKTTLVTSWLASMNGRPAAWFSIDENDNHFPRFFTYFIAAIQTVNPNIAQGLLSILQSTQTPEEKAILSALLHELAALNQPVLLVLDDYHLIDNEVIHNALATLVEYKPPSLHLVITSRELPPLPLPRWRVRNQLTEIDTADLRFTKEEAAVFMAQTMGLELDEAAISTLETRTEGWAAALQLAALSLKNNDDPGRFITEFGGSDRHIADYLLEEVLHRQSSDIQTFLQQTAILERFCGPLCDAVIGSNSSTQTTASSAVLEQLENSNLFLIPLDSNRRWYRYHHLFADLLQDRLRQKTNQTQVNELHRRASSWLAAEGLLEEAIYHAVQGKQYDEAARLIATIPTDQIWEQSKISLLKKWANEIPDTAYRKHPRAAMACAAAEMITGDFDNLYHHLDLIADAEVVRGEYALFQSILVRNQGDHIKALHLAREAGEFLDGDDAGTKAIALMQMAVNMFEIGKLAEADKALSLARDIFKSSHFSTTNMELQLFQMISVLHMEQIDFVGATNILQEGIALAKANRAHPLPMIGMMLTELGAIYYEWNELEKATDYFAQANQWGERTGISDIIVAIRIGEINLLCRQGDEVAVRLKIKELRSTIDQSRLDKAIGQMETLVASFNLRMGRLDEALQWANSMDSSIVDKPDFTRRYFYLHWINIRLAECRTTGHCKQLPQILSIIDHLLNHAKIEGFRHTTVEWLITKAMALDLAADRAAALQALQEAIVMAQPGRLVRTFLDNGHALGPLLAECEGEYATMLFDAYQEDMRILKLDTTASPLPTPPLDLTPREWDVLKGIVNGLSNKEIEEKLVISHNTVRTHIKNLYSKLNVSSRTQAAKKARDLGIQVDSTN